MSFDYVIFVGQTKDTLHPVKAAPTKAIAINEAKTFQNEYSCVEVTFMPEADIDTNEVVYSYYKEATTI